MTYFGYRVFLSICLSVMHSEMTDLLHWLQRGFSKQAGSCNGQSVMKCCCNGHKYVRHLQIYVLSMNSAGGPIYNNSVTFLVGSKNYKLPPPSFPNLDHLPGFSISTPIFPSLSPSAPQSGGKHLIHRASQMFRVSYSTQDRSVKVLHLVLYSQFVRLCSVCMQ